MEKRPVFWCLPDRAVPGQRTPPAGPAGGTEVLDLGDVWVRQRERPRPAATGVALSLRQVPAVGRVELRATGVRGRGPGSPSYDVSVLVARSRLPVPAERLDEVAAAGVGDVPLVAAVVVPLLEGCVGRLERLGRSSGPELAEVWVAVAVALLHAAPGQVRPAASPASLRVAVLRFIDAHLADPVLTPQTVAAALHRSRRSVYRALAQDGDGVAAVIRRRRLAAARALLLDDPRGDRSIAEIATEVGLRDPAHFSRSFRAVYGQSPRDLRRDRPSPA